MTKITLSLILITSFTCHSKDNVRKELIEKTSFSIKTADYNSLNHKSFTDYKRKLFTSAILKEKQIYKNIYKAGFTDTSFDFFARKGEICVYQFWRRNYEILENQYIVSEAPIIE